MNLLRRKSVTDLQTEALTDHSLRRALGALNLTMLWIGAMIGTGIFVRAGLWSSGGTVITLAGGSSIIAMFNLTAVIVIAIITTLRVIGIKESASVNNVIVFVKVAVVLLFIFEADHIINSPNCHRF